ncbi:MAG: hypothetical protein ACE5IL_15730 [Myxococcota bacterium]
MPRADRAHHGALARVRLQPGVRRCRDASRCHEPRLLRAWALEGLPDRGRRGSALGLATGAIAGLAAVAPASGFIGPAGGFAIGLASGSICWWASTAVKRRFGYDDSLDVFGVHGVGGFVGTVLAGALAAPALGGTRGDLAIGRQVGVQRLAAVGTALYTAGVSFVILKAIDATIGLRVAQADEVGYNL